MIKKKQKKETVKNYASEKVPLRDSSNTNTNKKLIQSGPKKWPTKMNVSLDEELYEKLKLLAEKEGRSMTKQLQYLVKQGLRLI